MSNRNLLLAARWAALLALCACAYGQQAQITGRVTDSSGGIVQGTEIRASNVDTGIHWDAASNEAGYYTIPLLPPGRYQMLVRKAGFKPISRTGIRLEVGQVARVDFVLEVGEVAETITVAGEIPAIQTEHATLGTVVERKRIENLPLNGRNALNLIKLVAGVQPAVRSAEGFAQPSEQQISQMRFNGGPVYANQVFFDGGSNNAQVHHEVAFAPSLETLQEFRVETNSLKAEYGQTSGGVINLVSKAGTNELHGSLFEFLRNDAFDARNAFATQRDPITGRIKQMLRYNQFGGTAGGPVYIPKVYNGRNRTFFFAGYERWRQRTAPLMRSTVPTPEQREGDFSRTLDGRGALIPVYDPATTRANPAGSGFVREIFPGNRVPAARFDRVSRNALAFLPLPNARPNDAFTNSLNFVSLRSFPMNQGTTSLRADHRLSDRGSLFFRYAGKRNERTQYGFGLGEADPDQNARTANNDSHNWILGITQTLSPSLIHEARFNVTRMNLPFIHSSFNKGWPQKLGLPASVPGDLFPRIDIPGMMSLGTPVFGNGRRSSHTVQAADSATWIRGKHTFKFGADQRWIRLNWVNSSYPSGQYVFAASLTNDPLRPAGTGVGMATFLLGEVSGGVLRTTPYFSFHAWSNGLFFQDDIKISPRLTLNVGLRYDLQSPPVERHNQYSNFEPFLPNPETGMSGMMKYAGAGWPRHFVEMDKNDFGPRIGFAYALTRDNKTVVRGGYGLIYLLTFSGNTQGDNPNALGFQGETEFTAPTLGPFAAFKFSDGPPRIQPALGASGGPSVFRGTSVRYQNRNAPSPYLQQWNFTLQRELPGKLSVSASYAGNRGVKLFGAGYNLNQMDPRFFSLGLGLQTQVSNPFFGRIASGALSGRTAPQSQLLRPFPDYLNITTLADHGAASSYHSLQVTAEKRYSGGLTALLSYTNSKLINDAPSNAGGNFAGVGDFRIGNLNRRLDRSIDTGDVSQRLVASAVYELPFGKGKPFASGARGAWKHAVGGWQLNTITTLETGMPLAVRGANNFTGINWPDVVRDPSLPRGERNVNRWFDTEAFRNPADFVIGNAPRTLPNTRGPGLVDVSFSAFKVFEVRENTTIEFRAESFNTLNYVNLNNPNVSFSPNRQGVNSNANFGRSLSSLDPRRLQFGLRLAF